MQNLMEIKHLMYLTLTQSLMQTNNNEKNEFLVKKCNVVKKDVE